MDGLVRVPRAGCQGVEGQCVDDVLELPQIPTNTPMASEKVLNWLYSVLVNVNTSGRVAAVSANQPTLGILGR